MIAINDIPVAVLGKVEEYACLQYKVVDVEGLKAAIVDERYTEIINEYLEEVTVRILRAKADEAKAYDPADAELIEKIQDKIDLE